MVSGLTTVVVTVFLKVYSDISSQRPITLYRPQCPTGYCALGDYAQGTHPEEPNYGVTLCFKADSGSSLLANPVGYIQVWSSDGGFDGEGVDDEDGMEWSGDGSGSRGSSGSRESRGSRLSGSRDLSGSNGSSGSEGSSGSSGSGEDPSTDLKTHKIVNVWRAIPPSDQYVGIGDIVTTGNQQPSRKTICVVHKSIVAIATRGRRIWLEHSGSVSLWSTAHSHNYLDLRTFTSNDNREAPRMGFRSLIPEVLPAPSNRHLITRTIRGKDLNLIYRDYGSGAYEHLSVYVPQPPIGFTALGFYAERGHEKSDTAHVQVVKEIGSKKLIVNPVKYRQVWNSKNTGSKSDASFWRPIPPPGYLCTGDVVTVTGAVPPSTNSIVCLHWSLLKRSHRGSRIWWNRVNPISRSRHPLKDVTIWRVGSKWNCQSPNTFVVHPGFVTPPSERLLFHCLPKTDIEV